MNGGDAKDYLAGDEDNDNLDGGYSSDTLIGGNGRLTWLILVLPEFGVGKWL